MGTPSNTGEGGRIVRRRREPTRTEADLWRRAIADVTPLVSRDEPVVADASPPAVVPEPPVATVQPSLRRVRPVRSSEALPELSAGVAGGVDTRTLARLRRGSIPPETQVDLHCCTQEEAHHLLSGFLAASQSSGRRCVLVITGKGYGSGGTVGVLKTMVPRWLNEPPNRGRVLAFCHAVVAHGGEGALYVLLRREQRRPRG